MVAATGLTAQQSNAARDASESDAVEVQSAPVIVDGHTLFRVRGVSAYPAEQRAQIITTRIRSVAGDREFKAQDLQVRETPFSTQIVAGKLVLVNLFDADAELEQVKRQSLATGLHLRIQQAIEDYRRERRPDILLHQTGLALAAGVGLILFWLVGARVLRLLLRALEGRYKHRIHEVGIQSLKLLPAERMWLSLIGVLKFIALVTGIAVSYAVLYYLLSLFPWTRGGSNNLKGIVLDPLRTMGNKVIEAIPNLVFLLILAIITYYLLKFIRLFFASVETGGVTIRGFYSEWARPTYRLIRGLVVVFALVVAYPYIPGSNTQAFKGVSLFIGLVFSLGSTSLIGNLISGFSLTYRRAFKTGDRVKIGEYVGDVQESKLLVTYLKTIKNEVIAVPNSSIINGSVINYSALAQTTGLILHTSVGIGYETPWRQVEAMLLEAAARTPGLLPKPLPFVLEKDLRSFDVEYEINVYSDQSNAMSSVYAALHRNILDVFNEYGVQIMTPAYEGDPKDMKVVPRDKWYSAPATAEPNEQKSTAQSATTEKR